MSKKEPACYSEDWLARSFDGSRIMIHFGYLFCSSWTIL
jgi:hypothetical protein